jgi:hypothetical protein
MVKVIKRAITTLIALTFAAVWYPSLPFPGARDTIVALMLSLSLTVVPAGLVWVGAGRSKRLEICGWCLQLATVALLFVD